MAHAIETAHDKAMGTKSVYCDCCGREKLAEVRDGKIVIVARRHGRKHVAVVSLGEC